MNQETLKEYVAHCPSCGGKLKFGKMTEVPDMSAVSAQCPSCERKWSMVFDIDRSGTFGVMSFQCDNEDRIM